MQQLFSVNYKQIPYAAFYPPIVSTLQVRVPILVTLTLRMHLFTLLLQNHPCVPVNATIVGNACCNCSQGFIDVTEAQAAAWYSTVMDNANTTSC